ncbi:MAG: hypothetical protein NW205_06115 [Hyphomicrobiaceae bacterium]|nr:hypothetical protein [Hyphomicrobiaceae bacterium]
MLGLLPVKRCAREIPDRPVGGNRDHQPVERHQQRRQGEFRRPTPAHCGGAEHHGDDISRNEAHSADVRADERPRSSFGADEARRLRDQRDVEPRVHECCQHEPRAEHDDAAGPPQPELADQPRRIAQMHREGLHPALQPARPLPAPHAPARRRLLPRRRCQHADTVPLPRQPEPQIGILRDVEGIPSARRIESRAAEVVRCTAQRDRQAAGDQGRQNGIEQRRILDCELARQEAVAGIMDVETGLHAGKVFAVFSEGPGCLAQLVRFRDILGIVDHDEVAAGALQRVIEGAGLRPWRSCRNLDDAHGAVQAFPRQRRRRNGITGLDDQHDVEPVVRIVEPSQRGDELGNSRLLVVERHQHHVGR